MKTKLCLVLFLGASLLAAQEPARPDVEITKVVTLQYPNRVNSNILDGIGLVVKRADNVVVITGPTARVDTAVDILHQLDMPAPPRIPSPPPKNVQLTAYLVIASAGNVPPSAAATFQGTPVPKDVEPAVTQVASMFSYKSFSLLDAIIMRTADGGAGSVSGLVAGGSYDMTLRRVNVTPDSSGDVFHLTTFLLNVKRANGVDRDGKDKFQMVAMGTDVDVKDGQKAVVGKANFDGASDALIVILTAKVVE